MMQANIFLHRYYNPGHSDQHRLPGQPNSCRGKRSSHKNPERRVHTHKPGQDIRRAHGAEERSSQCGCWPGDRCAEPTSGDC